MNVEPRLEKYVGKIHLIQNEENFLDDFVISARQKIFHNLEAASRKILNQNFSLFDRKWTERAFFYVERRTRDLATALLLKLSGGKGWVFVGDVDEYLEGSSQAGELQKHPLGLSGSKFFKIKRTRFVFDFDNLDYQFRTCPIVDVGLIAMRTKYRISEFRERQDAVFVEGIFKVTEFSYCLSRDGILTKLRDFSHQTPPVEEIENAFRLNHSLRYPDDPKSNVNWLRRVNLSHATHPMYVLDNIQNLKTNVINANYEEIRKIDYPDLFY